MAEDLKTIQTVDLSPFKCMVMTIGELPSSFVESMTYYEALAWLDNYLEKTLIPAVNNNAEAVKELQDLYIELHDYVENYFDNLDVQEEINNKLDAMAEAGTLEEIMADYLNTRAIFGFDTVADMKLGTNLTNGSFAKTLGFHSKSDEGGANYKIRTITNDDVVDEMTIIEIGDSADQLIAELVKEPVMNVKQFGAKGDNSTNDTTSLQAALNFCSSNGLELNIPAGTYKTNGLTTNAITIKGNQCIIKAYSNTNTTLLTLNGVCDIDGVNFDGNSLVNTLLHNNVFEIKLTNCTFKNSLLDAVDNTPVEDDDTEAYFENLTFTDCVGGIRYTGYPYVDRDDYKGTVKFINCNTNGNSGSTDDNRLYMFTKLNYVSVQGGNFTGNSTKGATNIYQVNHGEIIGGYYHDIMRGATLGLITEYCTVTNTINENISSGGGLHIDLVTADRVHPAGHSIIANNIVRNAYRGLFVQGKNLLITDNYIYCGSNLASSSGVIRFNDDDDNTTNSNIIVDNLYVYNMGSNSQAITCGTAIITLGKVYFDGTAINQTSVVSDNAIFSEHTRLGATSGSTHVNINDDVIIITATGNANVMLPNANETKTLGKKYTIIRTDATASTVSLRCRSDNGTINGLASGAGVVTIAKGVTQVVQTGAGEYWTLS